MNFSLTWELLHSWFNKIIIYVGALGDTLSQPFTEATNVLPGILERPLDFIVNTLGWADYTIIDIFFGPALSVFIVAVSVSFIWKLFNI